MENLEEVLREYSCRVSVSSRSYILSYGRSIVGSKVKADDIVSVSSRSYILSYIADQMDAQALPSIVSVSSRSYILSYAIISSKDELTTCFVSVSSRSYILSYKNGTRGGKNEKFKVFPSPLGVIFSLILLMWYKQGFYTRFRLLSELYSLLFGNWEKVKIKILGGMFPSPLGVIFSLI